MFDTTMFEDKPDDGDRVIGEITFTFLENDMGWYTRLTPVLTTTVQRDIYKMALVVAVLGDTCKRKLDAIDRLVMNNEEISLYKEVQAQEALNKPPGLADIDKYQTKLPFKGKGPESDAT
jgi:hypothetical protein